ncbi:plasmid partitioning/stability family protein [Klebsiella michiganensis]
MKQDERLPFLIAEFLTESTSMQDIQRIISSTLPQRDARRDGASGLRRF